MPRLTASCINQNLGGVTIIAALNFLVGTYLVLMSLLVSFLWLTPFAGVYLCVTALFLSLGYGLWKLHNWARQIQIVLSMIWAAGWLLFTIAVLRDVFDRMSLFVGLGFTALNVVIILYLLRPKVKQAFGASSQSGRDPEILTKEKGMYGSLNSGSSTARARE